MRAPPTATALAVRVFAANEARNAPSLASLDLVVREDLISRPVIEVHLTHEDDTKAEATVISN